MTKRIHNNTIVYVHKYTLFHSLLGKKCFTQFKVKLKTVVSVYNKKVVPSVFH